MVDKQQVVPSRGGQWERDAGEKGNDKNLVLSFIPDPVRIRPFNETYP